MMISASIFIIYCNNFLRSFMLHVYYRKELLSRKQKKVSKTQISYGMFLTSVFGIMLTLVVSPHTKLCTMQVRKKNFVHLYIYIFVSGSRFSDKKVSSEFERRKNRKLRSHNVMPHSKI